MPGAGYKRSAEIYKHRKLGSHASAHLTPPPCIGAAKTPERNGLIADKSTARRFLIFGAAPAYTLFHGDFQSHPVEPI